jgi:hypothetical protein
VSGFNRPDTFHALAFSPNGRLLAMGTLRGDAEAGLGKTTAPAGDIRLLDVRTGTEVNAFLGHAGAVHWLAFSGEGRWLASAALVDRGDRIAVERKPLWETGKLLDRLAPPER